MPGPQGLLGSMAHTLQKALQSTVSVVMWAPAAVLAMAGRTLHLTPARATSSSKSRAMSLSDALKGVTDNVVGTVVHYVPVSAPSQPQLLPSPMPPPPSEKQIRLKGQQRGSPFPSL